VPEGQSLALAAERLRPLVGEAVTEGALRGARIEAVESHGKQLLIRSDDRRVGNSAPRCLVDGRGGRGQFLAAEHIMLLVVVRSATTRLRGQTNR